MGKKIVTMEEEFNSQKDELEEKLRQLKNMEHEIDMMKMGSIAKIEQITTVSKMRILDPQKTGDVLYGVRLSLLNQWML